MIELHQFAPAFGLPNPSPFCMKVEGLLRLAGLPYSTVSEDDPRKAPRGKLPYIVVDGRRIADSAAIAAFLRDEYGFDADEGLSDATRAEHRAFIALLEDRLYWVGLYLRWIDETSWPLVRDSFFGHLPVPLRQLVPRLARAKIRRDLRGHGLGLCSDDEILRRAGEDWRALSVYLGDKAFFGGDKPVLLDVVTTALLANALKGPMRTDVRQMLLAESRLVTYAQRSLQRIYGLSMS